MSSNNKQVVQIVGALDPEISWPQVTLMRVNAAPVELNSSQLSDLIIQLNSKRDYLKNCEAIADIEPDTVYYFPKLKWYLRSIIENNNVLFFKQVDKDGQDLGKELIGASRLEVSTLRKAAKQPTQQPTMKDAA